MSSDVRPFRIAIGDEALDDLKSRLRRTRWPEAELVDDWSQGVPLGWIEEVCRYWAERIRLASTRGVAQSLRAVHHRDRRARYSFHPRPFAASQRDAAPHHPWLARLGGRVPQGHRTARRSGGSRWRSGGCLPCRLPVSARLRFFGQTQDHRLGHRSHRRCLGEADGTAGLRALRRAGRRLGLGRHHRASARRTPQHCAGIHITLAMSTRPQVAGEPTPEEARALKGIKYYADWDSGYSKQQSTRPQTVGYGLTDSPAGQAAWILEKFWAWTDCDGHPENILSRDELLDNVMLYWVTASAASSARLYWESFGPERRTIHKVGVPTGVAVFPREIVTPVRRWMEGNFSNIRHWNEMAQGRPLRRLRAARAVRRRRARLLPDLTLAWSARPTARPRSSNIRSAAASRDGPARRPSAPRSRPRRSRSGSASACRDR